MAVLYSIVVARSGVVFLLDLHFMGMNFTTEILLYMFIGNLLAFAFVVIYTMYVEVFDIFFTRAPRKEDLTGLVESAAKKANESGITSSEEQVNEIIY